MNDILAPSSVRITQDDVRIINRRFEGLLERRNWALKFPFGLSDTGLMLMLSSTIPDDIVQAINIVNNGTPDKFLNKTRWASVAVDDILLRVTFNTEQPVAEQIYRPEDAFYNIRQDNAYYSDLSEWARDIRVLRRRSNAAGSLLEHILECCNTSGQLFRAWPDLAKYMPKTMNEQLQHKTRASRLPIELDMVRVNRERPDASSLLALLSMLPDRDTDNQCKVSY